MKTPDPMYAGQQIIHVCPQDGQKHNWQAKYRKGELLWWCSHGKRTRPREIINRKWTVPPNQL